MAGFFSASSKVRLVIVAMALLLSACGSDSGPGSNGQPVEGTSASVNGKKTSPLYEGQLVGQLELIDGGCEGSSGSGGSEAYDVTLFIDDECEVFVESIVSSSND